MANSDETSDDSTPEALNSTLREILLQLASTTPPARKSGPCKSNESFYAKVRDNFELIKKIRANGFTFSEIAYRTGLDKVGHGKRLSAVFGTIRARMKKQDSQRSMRNRVLTTPARETVSRVGEAVQLPSPPDTPDDSSISGLPSLKKKS